MYKPASLRAHLLAQVPGLEADHLHTFIDHGHISATAGPSHSFVYHYTLNAILTDYAGHSDAVIIPILTWLRQHQPELLLGSEVLGEAFTFEADILSHETYDLGIKLKLSERVSVTTDAAGTATAQHHGEPPLDPYEGIKHWQLFVLGELVSEWDVPPTP